MILGVAFAARAAISCIAARALSAARWPYRAPRAAIALWQAVGLACGLALIGAVLSAGLAPYEQGVAFGLLELARRGSGHSKDHQGGMAVSTRGGSCLRDQYGRSSCEDPTGSVMP